MHIIHVILDFYLHLVEEELPFKRDFVLSREHQYFKKTFDLVLKQVVLDVGCEVLQSKGLRIYLDCLLQYIVNMLVEKLSQVLLLLGLGLNHSIKFRLIAIMKSERVSSHGLALSKFWTLPFVLVSFISCERLYVLLSASLRFLILN